MVTADMFGPGTLTGTRTGEGPPIPFDTKRSTPLDDGTSDGGVPLPLLWALKEHRRIHLDIGHHDLRGERLGAGDNEVWVIDTEHGHCTAGRIVGKSPDGVTYCLVGTTKGDAYVAAASNPAAVNSIFSEARHLVLCAVYQGTPSNVTDVRLYERSGDVPPEFLPPQPFIDFPESIEPETF